MRATAGELRARVPEDKARRIRESFNMERWG